MSNPLYGPYPGYAVESARNYLRGLGYDSGGRDTVKCAEGFNTPLWQGAVSLHLTRADLAKAEARGRVLIALAQTKAGRQTIATKGARAALEAAQ